MIKTVMKQRPRGRAAPKRQTPVRIVSASAAGSVLTITFNQTVKLKGVPRYTTDVAGADAVSAVLSNPTTLLVTFDAAIAAATLVTIPFNEPAVQSTVGGFVADSTFPC
jgi:hypothetical protein